jgi:diphthamide synthase (EF-2-diphthine--ammonia ligase)
MPGVQVAALITTFNLLLIAWLCTPYGAPWSKRRPIAPASRSGPWSQRAAEEGFDAFAFGDLFLEDIRNYRIEQLRNTGLEPLFPVWQIPTEKLARDMVAAGMKAKITCVDPAKLAKSFAGCDFDSAFLQALPPAVDPCGENGEFHTFVYDAPVFSHPIRVSSGEVVERDGFVFADVVPADVVPE